MRAKRSRRGRATVAAAGLAGLAALFVVVVTRGPLRPVERVFLLVGIGLLGLGVTVGSRLARSPRARLMDGRFGGDDHGNDAAGRHGRRDVGGGHAIVGRDGRAGAHDLEPALGSPMEEAR